MPEQRTTEITENRTGAVVATVASYYGPAAVVIERLGWRRLEEAAEVKQRDSIAEVKKIGGADVVSEFQKLIEDAQDRAQARQAKAGDVRSVVEEEKRRNPLAGYDARHLCVMGVETVDNEAKTFDLIDEWEIEVLEAVANAILRLARPGLYETAEARKND